MALPRRALVVCVGAAIALAGLALGAQAQKEGYLAPDPQSQIDLNQGVATGAVILLTAFVAAAGLVVMLAALAAPLQARRMSRWQAWLDRAGALAVFGICSYILVVFVQSAFPQAHTLATANARAGEFSNNLLASNSPALPSALLPVFGVFLAILLATLWAMKRLVAPADPAPWEDATPPDPLALLHRQLAILLLGTPFVGLAMWGALRLVVGTPAGRDGDPYRIALPILALCLLAFVATSAIKAWQLVRYLREPRTAPLCEEAWTGLGRAEAWLAAAIAAICLAASFFHPLQQSLLENGRTFGSDLRRHVQFLLLALVPLLPAWRLHGDGQRLFSGPPTRGDAPGPVWLGSVAGAVLASLALAGLATLTVDSPGWGWILACTPVAIAAQRLRPAGLGAPLLLVTAYAAWCVGNTLTAQYTPAGDALIEYTGTPGILALWRVAGAALAGYAAARLARSAGQAQGARVALPLAMGTGLCLVLVTLLELPLSIWTDSNDRGQLVAVGSALAAQEPAVQAVMHALALGAAVGAAVMVSRLLRPHWFGRGGRRSLAAALARPIA